MDTDKEIEQLEKLIELAKQYNELMKDYERPEYLPVIKDPRPFIVCPFKRYEITWKFDGTTDHTTPISK